MPWSPRPSRGHDARLDQYRNRVGELYRGPDLVGHVLVLAEHLSTWVGGHLWWRRWSPFYEIAATYIQMLDEEYSDDNWIDVSELDLELERWSRGQFPFLGEVLVLRWLKPSASFNAAQAHFGVEGFDENGDVVWQGGPR